MPQEEDGLGRRGSDGEGDRDRGAKKLDLDLDLDLDPRKKRRHVLGLTKIEKHGAAVSGHSARDQRIRTWTGPTVVGAQ